MEKNVIDHFEKHRNKIITSQDRLNLIIIMNAIGLNGNGVEVGTYWGSFAYSLLGLSKLKKLFCVDPYMNYSEFEDSINSEDFDSIFSFANNLLSIYQSERYQFVRKTSESAALDFSDESLDFVYIDGNHKFSYAYKDIEVWFPKVKTGGLIALDDCIDSSDANRDNEGDVVFIHSRNPDGTPKFWGKYGVHYAIRKFSELHGFDFYIIGTQGYMIKK